MSKKVLIVASTASMIKQFNLRNIEILQKKGIEVWVAANFTNPGTITNEAADNLYYDLGNQNIKVLDVPFGRGMGSFLENVKSCSLLNKILKKEKFEFIHVHAALASVLTRLVAFFRDVPVIYTAHGFQFMKNGSRKRWVLFFPIEFMLSFLTSELITINQQDHEVARRFFHCNVHLINGVGIDYNKFMKKSVRSSGQKNNRTFITVGELSNRKNQEMIIKAFSLVQNKEWTYNLVGIGPEDERLKQLVKKLGLEGNINFLGYCDDIVSQYYKSDVAIFASRLEGLLTAGMEAMATGLPVIYSDVRGITDYLENEKSGFKITELTPEHIAEQIDLAMNQENYVLKQMGNFASKRAKEFDKSNIDVEIEKIYDKWI